VDWIALSQKIDLARKYCKKFIDHYEFKGIMKFFQYDYNPVCDLILDCWINDSETKVISTIALRDPDSRSKYLIPPHILEAMFHSTALADGGAHTKTRQPIAIDTLYIRQEEAATKLWQADWCTSYVKLVSRDGCMSTFDCTLVSARGTVICFAKGVKFNKYAGLESDDFNVQE
jgi:hypothetical protein